MIHVDIAELIFTVHGGIGVQNRPQLRTRWYLGLQHANDSSD